MAVYFMFSYDVVDGELYQQYVAAVTPLLVKHGAEVLTAAHGVNAVEGAARTSNIVLKFASEEAARAWYDDPDYEAGEAAAARCHRERHGTDRPRVRDAGGVGTVGSTEETSPNSTLRVTPTCLLRRALE